MSRSALRFGVIVFPGSNCDTDTFHALADVMGCPTTYIWHHQPDLDDVDAVILPGGFAYGDYLRAGALARFSPVMAAVERFAAAGGPVIGICNGFQVLCEAGLLPGALHRNQDLRFRCADVHVRVETDRTPLTAELAVGDVLQLPIAHGEGSYYISEPAAVDLAARRQIVFRYCDSNGAPVKTANPNGSVANIAGVCSRAGNVVGLMPHPERRVEELLGGEDGRRLLASVGAWSRLRAGATGGGR